MVSDQDGYRSTDITERSNQTSLNSDVPAQIAASVQNDRPREDEPAKKKVECKCRSDVPPPLAYCIPPQQNVVSPLVGKAEGSKVVDDSRGRNVRFDYATPCVCHGPRIAYTLPMNYTYGQPRRSWCRFNWKWPRREYLKTKDKTYQVKLKETQCPHYAKPFVCCQISENVPTSKPEETQTTPVPAKPPPPPPKKKEKEKEKEKPKQETCERIDIYYFDHGNSAYYLTTDCPPVLSTDKCAEKTEMAATRFWAEIFGTIHIGTSFVTAFVLQLLRFILFSVVRPLTVGILQLLADYFLKPILSILFNAIIQPILILLYNIATSIKDLCEPLAEAVGLFLRELAHLCRAIRLVEVKQTRPTCPIAACT